MKRRLVALLTILALTLAACGTASAGNATLSDAGTMAATDAATSTQPPTTETAGTNPPTTQPATAAPSTTNPPTVQPTATEPPVTNAPTTQPPASEPPIAESTESLATAEITLPAFVFEGEDMKNFDPEAYAEENDFISAVVNNDSSVTIILTQNRYQELLNDAAKDCDAAYLEIVEDTSYITDIVRNEDFTQITVKVIREGYESTFDLTHVSVGYLAYFYQIILGAEPHSDINIIDAATGDVIFSCAFPDILE